MKIAQYIFSNYWRRNALQLVVNLVYVEYLYSLGFNITTIPFWIFFTVWMILMEGIFISIANYLEE